MQHTEALKSIRNKIIPILLLVPVAFFGFHSFTRIKTGEVGVRVDFSKEVQPGELLPGSWNQNLIGTILTFPVRDITISLDNKTPLTADNSALADFDISVVYEINPGSVAELYSKKAKSFHQISDGDWLLMYNYVGTLVNNAAYKAIRQYKALEVADNRSKLEQEIRQHVAEQLASEKLETAIHITVVQIRNVQPNAEILRSATEYVRAQNELRVKETEVEIAKKESERMAALAVNSAQSIAYMQAQAQLKIAEGIAAGKVNTIVVPMDFRGMVNIGAKN